MSRFSRILAMLIILGTQRSWVRIPGNNADLGDTARHSGFLFVNTTGIGLAGNSRRRGSVAASNQWTRVQRRPERSGERIPSFRLPKPVKIKRRHFLPIFLMTFGAAVVNDLQYRFRSTRIMQRTRCDL